MSAFVRIIAVSILCSAAWAADESAMGHSALSSEDRLRLLEGLQCPAASWDALFKLKSGFDADNAPSASTTMCGLAMDAFCAASPAHVVCRDRKPSGAYAGYYLMRYAMPVVVMSRQALRSAVTDQADTKLSHAGFESLFRLLGLLSPGLGGCSNLPRVRTWCTVNGDAYQAVPTHRAAVAYFAAESLRLFAECRKRGTACPIPADKLDATLVRWFDVLLWDHALLDGTVLRNSLTQHVPSPTPAAVRFRYMRDSFNTSAKKTGVFRFATDGWWMAVAANLIAVDALLLGDGDPRPVALTGQQKSALESLVELGVEVLAQRAERTSLRNFEGDSVQGLQFDSRLWDKHEYRRFSAVEDGPRPFSVVIDAPGAAPRIVFAGPEERRAENVGLDSGHYRRLTWLHYTLSDAGQLLDTDWTKTDLLEGLANQFAYSVHWHPCHHRREQGCGAANASSDEDPVPRFVNYVSGRPGWYRLTPSAPCDPGVPPFGFSTLMVISENLWWARFNVDVERIWARVDAAVNDPALPPPSRGDTYQCGDTMGAAEWDKTYHRMVFDSDGHITNHGLGFLAMKYWAELALKRH